MRSIVFLVLVSMFTLTPRFATAAEADAPHLIAAGDVWKSVAGEPDTERAERATIMRVLEHPLTREVARSHGLDLQAAEARVSLLQGAELERVSATAAAAESRLGPQGAIVISEYALIIILLVVIVLLLL